MAEWPEKLLGDLIDNFDSIRVPIREIDRKPGPFPYYGASGIVDYIDDYLFDGEYLLIAEDGENLRTRNTPIAFLARGRFWVNNHAHIVRGNGSADTRFLMYALVATDINGYLTGSTMPKLTQDNMNRIPILAPPMEEQRAIAHILGALDAKIELNRRTNQTLEAMARALFESWFVDFDPVRAKAEGRDPELPEPIANLFPDRFADSELGRIPEGWRAGTLAELAVLNPEAWSLRARPEIINYIDLSNTKWGQIESVTSYESQLAPSRAQRILRPGDTVVGTVRPGNGSYAFISADGLTGSTGFAVLRPRRPEYAEFIYLATTAPETIEALSHLADGAAYPAVRPEAVAATQTPRPRDALIDRFSALTRPLLRKIAQTEQENSTLAALRNALLPKLISGELRVKDAKQLIEAAQ